jgi:methylated-DNA-[protein]-cysteine S-methyltransferase
MTRKGRIMEHVYLKKYNSPVGGITIAANNNALVGVWIEGQKYDLSSCRDCLTEYKDTYILDMACDWLDGYFKGEKPEIERLPLCPRGSEFRQKVWKILCRIPYGKTVTYGDIAHQICDENGISEMSAQAVGGAVGHNPISIIIPCHRVVGSDGSMTGYAGGIDIKVKLLRHEGVRLGDNNKILN